MVKFYSSSNIQMPVHDLRAKVSFENFKEGDKMRCYIQKMSDGRFGVMSSTNFNNFYKVFTEEELHKSFNETD